MTSIWHILLGVITYFAFRTIYRLYLHPLSRIPGPQLAAATHLYEFYYNVITPGQFLFQIGKLHQEYGPIVRITPREVHVIDPEFYEEIYAPASRRREKDPKAVPALGLTTSMVATVSHEHHHFRRNILKDFFSKRSILDATPLIDERMSVLHKRLDEFQEKRTTISLDDAYAALVSDIVTTWISGHPSHFLEDENFNSRPRRAVEDTLKMVHINRFFPWIGKLQRKIPLKYVSTLFPGKAALLNFLHETLQNAMKNLPDYGANANNSKNMTVKGNMIATMLNPSIPAEERTNARLSDELFAVIGAGIETITGVLTYAAYQISKNPEIRDKLREELKPLLPTIHSTSTWSDLEQLPYLTAVVNESLRLALTIVARLPLVAPTESLKYKHHTIPPGWPISSNSYFMHRDPTIFPDPETFDPERWITATKEGHNLKRYLGTFSKGTRSCIGINLAYNEIYLAIAYFARRYDAEIYDTEPEDIVIVRDSRIAFTRRGTLKVYAKLSGAS